MKHTTSRLLFSYWDALRADRAAPERKDVDPGRIREILADTFIIGLDPDGSAAFRLAGTRVSAMFARNLKDLSFEALWPEEERSEPRQLIEIVSAETTGVVAGLVGTTAIGFTIGLELLLLPLRHRGSLNARIIGTLSSNSSPTWLGLAPIETIEMRSLRVIRSAPQRPTEIEEVSSDALRRRSRFVVLEGGLAR